jgi:hypothetical protein
MVAQALLLTFLGLAQPTQVVAEGAGLLYLAQAALGVVAQAALPVTERQAQQIQVAAVVDRLPQQLQQVALAALALLSFLTQTYTLHQQLRQDRPRSAQAGRGVFRLITEVLYFWAMVLKHPLFLAQAISQ